MVVYETPGFNTCYNQCLQTSCLHRARPTHLINAPPPTRLQLPSFDDAVTPTTTSNAKDGIANVNDNLTVARTCKYGKSKLRGL